MIGFIWTIFTMQALCIVIYLIELANKQYPEVKLVTRRKDVIGLVVSIGFLTWAWAVLH